MTDQTTYTPPAVWTHNANAGGKWAAINRPVSGSTHDKELPIGKHPLQLYSLATPNGQKVTIMLEELLALGIEEAEYDAHFIDISEGDQFSSGFVSINPNSKIPALYDQDKELRVFESGAILLYLADKFEQLLPEDHAKRTEALNWLFWLQGAAPYVGGGFGHFYHYAPAPIEYAIDRFTLETKRLMDVLDKQLANHAFVAGDDYSIADIAIWPWFGGLVRGAMYDAAEFLQIHEYEHLLRWANNIAERPAVKRGRMVNRSWGDASEQLRERHDASDFDRVA